MPPLQAIADLYPGRLHLINGDALQVDPLAHLTAPIRVVANLPYNIGTELLVRWLTPAVWPPFWDSLTLMFQREVAERIVAKPRTEHYGRLALLAQWRCDARIVMTLPPEAFTPAPKVHSAVVHLTRLEAPRFAADGAVDDLFDGLDFPALTGGVIGRGVPALTGGVIGAGGGA